ncbi:hypothetical protein LQ772_06880 [Frateuria edaphi]|uniref:baseplate J/gp47 family protein n=1 Tax=Frateuria edaphi TaxID=2898793 RepID=UPI001E4087C8|nr:baseplate J/gp47 family protein [Frateuria edaphi]UGB47010.1 hypothetical protein LQ772_06880 [Frateuria edaphi]
MAISTTAPTISATGISAPSYAEVLDFLQTKFRGIYGADLYLGADSQDGQWLAILAKAIDDANAVAIQVYNSFSPATATAAALSSNVKINGIARASASYSTADLVLVGQAGTTITDGVVTDTNNNRWDLPASVVIPSVGEVTATATCETEGAIAAPAGTITRITTPALGWQSVSNPTDATPGAPVETDAALRKRQATSVAVPSLTVLEGIMGAVAAVPAVTRYRGFENDTNATDANGIPAHTIALVVDGGDATAIAQAIASKKTPGGGTAGTTEIDIVDAYGITHPIRFYRPTDAPITVAIALKALAGYSSAVGALVQQAVADYVNGVVIGGGPAAGVEWDAAIAAAKSVGGSGTFKITALTLSGPGGAGSPDVPLAFNEAATCSVGDVTLTVT